MAYEKYGNMAAGLMIAVFSILYMLVTINSPIVFGDEGYYGTASRWMAENKIIPEFYPHFETKIYHERFAVSKPVFFLYETFGYFFGGEFLVKILLPLTATVSALLIYFLGKKFFSWPAGLIAAGFFLMTPAVVTYGVLGYTDILFVALSLGAILFGTSALAGGRKIHILLAGIFTGLALLTKNSAAFLFLFFLLYEIFIAKLKNKKYFFAIVVIAFALAAPWLARNFILFGSPCYWKFYTDEQCGPVFDSQVPRVEGLKFEGRTEIAGTEADLFRYGFLNFARFAYGWALPALFFFGLSIFLMRRGKPDKIIMLLILSTLPLFYFSTWRAEDTARYMLPLVAPLALAGGAFVSELFSAAAKKHAALGAILLLIILFFSWPYGSEKLAVMGQVKQFVPGAIDACQWVKQNTPQDSILFATYGSQIRYQCDRKLGVARDAEEVMLGNESVSYEHLKLNGINYVFVINGLITQQKLQENYPLSFVQMMENSTHFKKVYDNSDKFGPQLSARIFEVL